jgi:hypothetical protein
MDIECPRCDNKFQADEVAFGDNAKCQKCGLLIETCHDDSYEYFDGETMQLCYVFNDIPADCCKACENLNLESCVGICRMDSESDQDGRDDHI